MLGRQAHRDEIQSATNTKHHLPSLSIPDIYAGKICTVRDFNWSTILILMQSFLSFVTFDSSVSSVLHHFDSNITMTLTQKWTLHYPFLFFSHILKFICKSINEYSETKLTRLQYFDPLKISFDPWKFQAQGHLTRFSKAVEIPVAVLIIEPNLYFNICFQIKDYLCNS